MRNTRKWGGYDHETVKKPETATDSNAEREETEAEDDGNADVETDADTEPEQGELTTATDSNADREELPTATDSDADVIEAQEEDPADEPEDAEALENSEGSVVEILRIATDSNAEENDSNSTNNSNSPGNSDNSGHEIFDDPEFDDEEILNDIPVLTDIPVTWEMDGLRETEDGSMYYLPVLPVEYVLADGVELPEIQVSVESGIAVLAVGDEIDIAQVDTTATNGQIIINANNLQDWDGKILTGSVTSTGLYDPGKGIVIQGGQSDSDWITVNLTIRDLTIDRREYMRNGFSAISVEGSATLNLTIEGDNKLYGAYGGAGIGVVGHSTGLCITGNNTGSLYAKGGNGYGGAAGIGSISPGLDLNSSSSEPKTQECGVITIAGGNITAEGGTYSFRGSKISGGAGIGATYGMSAGHITISGGTVHAIGGCGGAGIGGGTNGSVDTITINGGTVIAEGTGIGSKQPAAIGLGVDTNTDESKVPSCGTIDIGHANVTAKGNIGYGYVLSGHYPEADVTIWNDVYLTLDGVVNAGGVSVKQYELNFSVFDTSFKEGTEIEIQSVELDGNKIQENITAEVKTPGRADFTISFAHTTFSENREFYITVEGKEYPYDATINFVEDETKYHGIAGIELYPVDLEFYDNAITEDIVPEELTIKQDGKTLAADDYVTSKTIEKVDDGVGRMRVFLPSNEGATEITVQADSVNGSTAMTRTGLTISKDGITSVVMCSGIVTLSAEVTKLNSDGVTIAVKSNALNWELYAYLKTKEITDITPEQIESSNELAKWTVQNGTISKSNLGYNKQYYCYLVAKQEDRYSPIVCVKFATPYGARMFWENGDSNGYGRFLDAIDQTRDIAQEGFTIQALGTSEEWSGGYVTLQKSGKLDLNGKNITINNVTCSLALADGVSAVITDTAGGAEYHNDSTNDTKSFFIMNANSSLTIQGGSYDNYRNLLEDGGPTGRTLTIEGGSFHGKNNINIGGNGTLILSGGTFYGGLNVGGGGKEMGDYLKHGYCFHYLSGDKAGTYTTTLLLGTSDDIEVVPYPTLEGELTLTIGNGLYSQATSGTTLTASFARKGNATGTYTYTWYRTDGTTETQISQTSETTETTDTYKLTDYDIGKQIYCVVKEAQSSGSVESEKTYPVIGYSIENAVITLEKGSWTYDGTEKKPKVQSVMLGENLTLVERTHYTVSYDNNIDAGDGAKVIITGIYEGTATITFEIKKKRVTNLTFEGIQEEYEYTGEEIRPQFTLKDGDVTIPDSEYTVEYFHNIKPTTTGYITAVRVTPKSAGNYSFISYTTGEKQFKIVHTHDWKCSVGGWVINLECKKNVCPFQNKRATIMLYVDDAENLAYNGKTQNVATVWQAPSDAYTGDLKVEYAGDGLENGLPKNAGKYTASLTITENGVSYTAKNNFEIKKVTPDIGTVTAGELTDTVDVNQVQLSRANTTVPGTLKLKEGTELQWGTHEYEWVFEPDDSTNYNSVEGTVSITVKDTIPPTAEWKIGTSAWKEFVNTITLGHLCKNPETMEIRFSDALSGIAKQQYYIANQRMTDFSGVTWIDYSSPINLPLGREKIVYVRVEDRNNNVVILNSDKFAVYQESSLQYNEISYKYKEGQPKEIRLEENGNTFANVVNESGENLENSSYDYLDGRLTLKPAYLNSLSVGTHSYKILMYPQGNQEYPTIAYDFQIKVEKPKLYVAGVRASDKKYDGNNFADIMEVVLASDDVSSIENVSVDMTGLQGTLESADAGTYSKITLPELTLTGTEAGNYELIQPTAPVEIWRGGVTITKASAVTVTPMDKSYVYLKPTEEHIDLSELLPKDCGETTFTYLNSTDSTIKNFEYYEQPPTIQGNILSYKTMKTGWSQVGLQKQGEIHVKAQTTNYEDMLIVVKLRLRDQTKVVLKDGMQVKLKNHVLTYGEPLSKLKFEDAVFTDEAGNEIAGTFGWTDDTEVPAVGTTRAMWWFHADDLEYTDVYGDVEIVVNPAELTVASAAAEDRVYDKNSDQVTISAVTLSGVRDQDDVAVDITGMQGTLSSVDAGDYTKVRLPELVLTGTDASNYKLVQPTGSVALSPKVTIRKADAQITWPTAGTIEAGNPLKDAALTGGSTEYGTFTWKNPEQKAEAGTHSYAVVFTPDAKMAKNYDIKTMTQMVKLTATEPPKEPEKPSGDAGNTNGSNSSGNSSSSTGRDKDRDSSAGRATERNTWSEKKVGGTTRWRYYENTGRYARNTWKHLTYNGTISWYHFGADGYMDTGWFMDTDGRWYYLNPVSDGTQGAMKTGWFTDPQDGHRYYLDPKTGAMVTGWKLIDGIWYYFNETSSGTSGWSYSTTEKKWVYVDKKQKPLGILEENKKR